MNGAGDRLGEWLAGRVDASGIAPVDRFVEAPREHHPSYLLEGAKSVVVTGRAIPRGIFHSPAYGLHLLHRASHSAYNELDSLGLKLAIRLESEGDLAVVVPAYAPLTVSDSGTRGLLSLKHAAVLAGLGSIGRSGLVYKEDFGSLLRFGAVVTTAALGGSPLVDSDPCPAGCTACADACPEGALAPDFFNKVACALKTSHSIFQLTMAQDRSPANRELVLNTAGYNYWLNCSECQRVCPLNS